MLNDIASNFWRNRAMPHLGRRISTFSTIVFMLLGTQATMARDSVDRANLETIGIVSGSVTGTYARFAQDLSNVLDEEGDLRVLAILGKGSVQNIRDLLRLRGVDIAIVQSDVLENFRKTKSERRFEERIAYITKLYNEEVHLIARQDIHSIEDLAGKTVDIGPEGSGTAMTARIILEKLGIKIKAINMSNNEILEAFRGGDIAAAFFVVGKPATYFRELSKNTKLHFLPIQRTRELANIYLKSSLNDTDYPNFIPPGKSVDTIAVGAVMAVFRWRKGMERYSRTEKFIDRFFSNIEIFKTEGYHPKWQDVNIRDDLVGWSRFQAAQAWLDNTD